MTEYRNELNTVARRRGKQPEYNDVQSGPNHDPEWTSVVGWDGIEYGRGKGKTRKASREAAACAALQLLAQQPDL